MAELSKNELERIGLVPDHAYTLLKILPDLPLEGQETVTLVKMRNPWGNRAWKGDWSFDSEKWSPELRKRVRYERDFGDGVFFISMADFAKYFDNVNISRVELGNINSWVDVNPAFRCLYYRNEFCVEQDGEYHFTIYQENKKKYRKSHPNF